MTHLAFDRPRPLGGREVGLFVPDTDPGLAAAAGSRFLREARALARFDHPGIVRVYEAFEEAGTAFVTEYLHGRSLSAELVARTVRSTPRRRCTSPPVSALVVVHGGGLLHRDVSPSNVVLADDGRGRRPVLIDFGLTARWAATPPTS